MKFILKIAAILTGAAMLGGCGGPYRASVQKNALHDTEQLVLQGFGTSVTTSAVRLVGRRTGTGSLEVVVQLIREHFGSKFVEVNVVFLDEDKLQLEQTNWEPIHLAEDMVTEYRTASISTRAADFRVTVRPVGGR